MTGDITARPDGALQPALHRFQDAVSALIDPQRQILHGHTMYLDSLYDQLQDSLAGQQGHTGDRMPRSLPILWIDAHDCLAEIDHTVAQWPLKAPLPDEPTRPRPIIARRLQTLSEAKYRPQDTGMLTGRATQLETFTQTIRGLLLPEIVIYLRGHSCPICGQTHIKRRDNTGAEVSAPTLMIRGDSALCQQCRAVWEYSRLPLLGRILGLQPAAQIGS